MLALGMMADPVRSRCGQLGDELRDRLRPHGATRRNLPLVLLRRPRVGGRHGDRADATEQPWLRCVRAHRDRLPTRRSNVAYMSGRITYSSNPAEGVVGELNRWSVQDNGEPGIGAFPDLVSSVPTNPTNDPTQTCDLQRTRRSLPSPRREPSERGPEHDSPVSCNQSVKQTPTSAPSDGCSRHRSLPICWDYRCRKALALGTFGHCDAGTPATNL